MKKILTFLLFYVIAFNSYSQSFINVWGNYKSTTSKVETLPETFLSTDPTGKTNIMYERIKTPDFVVITSDGKKSKQSVIQYKSTKDFSVITKTESGWFGYFNNDEGNWNLTETGVVKDDLENLKRVGELDEIEVPNTLNKSVPETNQTPPDFYDKTKPLNKICKVYIEVCNDLYVRWGANTVSQVSMIFGTVRELYARDGIQIQLGEIFIWTTIDPYANLVGSQSILIPFATNRQTNPWRFKHLLNNKNYGGIAYVNAGMIAPFAFAYSGLGGYETSSSSTVYSWPLYVFAHEMGHNLGARHTHWGCWKDFRTNTPIGRLDSCYSCEPCEFTTPTCNSITKLNRNGTIMSYCHINGNVNPSRGFGIHPTAWMRKAIWESTIPFETTTSCITTYSAWTTCTNGLQTRTFTQTGTNCVTPPADSLSRTCTIAQSFQITNQVCYKGTDGKWRVKFNMTLNPTSYPTISLSLCRYGNSTGNCNGANLTPSACGARTFSALTATEKSTGVVDRVLNPVPAILNSCYRMQIKVGTSLIWTPYFIYN
jgi:hypothetical protein